MIGLTVFVSQASKYRIPFYCGYFTSEQQSCTMFNVKQFKRGSVYTIVMMNDEMIKEKV